MSRKLLLLLVIVAAASVHAAEYRESSTGTVFPDICDAWQRTRVDEDPRAQIGVSVAYSIKGGSAVTCRIFDGQFGRPSEDPVALRKELEEIASGVTAVWTKMGARVELALPVNPLPQDNKQFVVVHRIEIGDRSTISITLFRFYRGRYLSFRFTTLGADGTAAFHELGRFLAALRAADKNSANKSARANAHHSSFSAHASLA